MEIASSEIGLVVLAAGRSTRMGTPKALVELDGRPLLEHLLTRSLACEFGDAVVVLGHHADALRPIVERLSGKGDRHPASYAPAISRTQYPGASPCLRWAVNPDPDRGRTSSVQTGLRSLRAGMRAVFIQPVDCPLVRHETYHALIGALGSAHVAVPSHQGQQGHPPLVSAELFPRILAAGPDEPLRDLLASPNVRRAVVEVDDPGVLLNVDRPEDLARLRGELGV